MRIDNQQRDSGLPFVLWLAAACTMLSLACGGKTTIAPGGAGSTLGGMGGRGGSSGATGMGGGGQGSRAGQGGSSGGAGTGGQGGRGGFGGMMVAGTGGQGAAGGMAGASGQAGSGGSGAMGGQTWSPPCPFHVPVCTTHPWFPGIYYCATRPRGAPYPCGARCSGIGSCMVIDGAGWCIRHCTP
ncbi:MAG: hypothetical protein MJD61_02660 [Proteobacteria bacterium]|nr:hypothetical protein [Pseudomonadota bacterium]